MTLNRRSKPEKQWLR